jgi:RimJ/RimL family protein N-acetyltransferase
LERILLAPDALETELGFPISRAMLEGVVQRALRMKLDRMQKQEPNLHPWFTYWLIVTPNPPFGAGMVGFKGAPDETGAVEIGYGIDPACQNQGYITEAVKAMLEWAFSQTACTIITAKGVLRSNLASQSVLLKCGFTCSNQTDHTFDYVICRPGNE